MKNCLILITAGISLALAGAAAAQDASPTPAPAAKPVASATPAPSPSPASAAPTATPSEDSTAAGEMPSDATPEPAAPDILPDVDLGAPAPDAKLPSDQTETPDALNPDNTLIAPETGSAEAPPPPPAIAENKFDQERRLNVRYQEVKLQALKDASIRNMHDQAEKAKTDEAKRQALREYYRLLFAKMVSIDSALKDKCDTMQQAYLRRMGQFRVEPTIPLQPPPTPEPLVMADASPTPKPKAKRGE